MDSAREFSDKSDFNYEEFMTEINKINGKKQIKTSAENIQALKEDYEYYKRNSDILLEKSNKKVNKAVYFMVDLEDNIKDVKSFEKKNYLDEVENNIEIIEKFLDKNGKYQYENTLKSLSSLLSQAKAIVYIEKQLMDISTRNIIEESTTTSLKLQIKENIFSENLKSYYIDKVNELNNLYTFSNADEEYSNNLESEYEKLTNQELKDDFEEKKENSSKTSNLSRFVKFSKKTAGKIKEGNLGKITRARIRIENLKAKLSDKNVTSSELEQEISEIEKLLKSKKAILKSDKEDKKVQEENLKELKLKVAEIKAREQQEEKAAKENIEKEQKKLEANKKNKEQYDKIFANFKEKPNEINYQTLKKYIEVNKNNKEIFENEEAYKTKLEEIKNLHNMFIQHIEETIYKSLLDKPLSFKIIDSVFENKFSISFNSGLNGIDFKTAMLELGKEKSGVIYQKIGEKIEEFLEKEIEEVSKRDTEKGRELYAENLKRELLKREYLFEAKEVLNDYIDRIEEAKNKSKTNDDELMIEMQNKLKNIMDNPTYIEIGNLYSELESSKDDLDEKFITDMKLKITELYLNLVNKDFKQIETSPSIESIEELLNNMDLVNIYLPDLLEIEEKLNKIKEDLNKNAIKEEMKEKITKLSINPTYIGIDSLYSELESGKEDLEEKFITDMKLKITELYLNLVNEDFKQVVTSPSIESIEELLNNMDLVNIYLPDSLEIKEKLNQMKEDLNKKTNEDQIIKEILNDVEEAMNIARDNPTKENIEKARDEINKYKYNSDIFSKDSLKKNNKADDYLRELDTLSRATFNENVFGNEIDYEQYDRIINAKISSLDDLYEKLGKIEYNIHMLEGQIIAPEQKENRLRILNAQKSKIELELARVKEQVEKYEKLKEEKRNKTNYYDKFFEGVSHLTDEQLAAGVKQNMSYEELAEISKNLEKAEKLTANATEEIISKKDISESAYENITKSISTAVQTRLNNPQLAKELIEKANSIFNQNYFVYSEAQREQLNEYLQTATSMIESELYRNENAKKL